MLAGCAPGGGESRAEGAGGAREGRVSAAGESGVHCWGMRERGACGGSLTPASRTHMSTPTMSTVKSASNGLERTEPSAPRSRASNPIPREIAYCTRTYCTLLTGTGATCTCSTSTVPLPLPYYVVRLYPATAKAHTHQLPPPVGFSKTASQGAQLPLPHRTRLPHTQQARSMSTLRAQTLRFLASLLT